MSVHMNLIVRAYVFSYNMSVGISQPVITKRISSCIIVIKQRILITYKIQIHDQLDMAITSLPLF